MDRWTDRLSAYLDDEMGREERAELDAHMAECGECAGALEELRAVVGRAHGLQDLAPDTDLWPGILTRIEAGADVVPIGVAHEGRGRRRFALTFPQAAAAGLALMLTGAAAAWLAVAPAEAPPPVVAEAADPAPPSQDGVLAAYRMSAQVESRIAHLESVLDATRTRLDPETVAVIEKNLAIVEAAVQEAEAALMRDPANDYLRAHLDRTLRTKVDMLERATTLAET